MYWLKAYTGFFLLLQVPFYLVVMYYKLLRSTFCSPPCHQHWTVSFCNGCPESISAKHLLDSSRRVICLSDKSLLKLLSYCLVVKTQGVSWFHKFLLPLQTQHGCTALCSHHMQKYAQYLRSAFTKWCAESKTGLAERKLLLHTANSNSCHIGIVLFLQSRENMAQNFKTRYFCMFLLNLTSISSLSGTSALFWSFSLYSDLLPLFHFFGKSLLLAA